MTRVIGEGAFGKVYLGKWQETDVAIKVLTSLSALGISGHDLNRSEGGVAALDPTVRHTLEREVGIMVAIRHPNIILFMGVCLSPPAIVTEYCARGSLYDLLRHARDSPQLGKQLDWTKRLGIALDSAKGMLHLHSHKPPIVHRDLKSPNLLVDSRWRAKVTDFNLSRAADSAAVASSLVANNPRWNAPEVIHHQAYSKASDVYSFGLVLWELLTWELPWADATPFQIILSVAERGARPRIPDDPTVASAGAGGNGGGGGGGAGQGGASAPSASAAGKGKGDAPGAGAVSPSPPSSSSASQGAPPGGFPADWPRYASLMKRCWAQDPEERPGFDEVIVELRAMAAAQRAVSRPGQGAEGNAAAAAPSGPPVLARASRAAIGLATQHEGTRAGRLAAATAAAAGLLATSPSGMVAVDASGHKREIERPKQALERVSEESPRLGASLARVSAGAGPRGGEAAAGDAPGGGEAPAPAAAQAPSPLSRPPPPSPFSSTTGPYAAPILSSARAPPSPFGDGGPFATPADAAAPAPAPAAHALGNPPPPPPSPFGGDGPFGAAAQAKPAAASPEAPSAASAAPAASPAAGLATPSPRAGPGASPPSRSASPAPHALGNPPPPPPSPFGDPPKPHALGNPPPPPPSPFGDLSGGAVPPPVARAQLGNPPPPPRSPFDS